jgi:hypothetical protein
LVTNKVYQMKLLVSTQRRVLFPTTEETDKIPLLKQT